MTTLTFNVAQLLREHVGARRDYAFTEERLLLDDTLVLRDIRGQVVFTRTASGVFAHVQAQGVVRLVCVRSLEVFDQPVELDMADEFHSVCDVVTGSSLPKPTEDDPFFLNELHMADIGEAIREYTLLELPLNPVCDAWRDYPVNYTTQSDDDDHAENNDDDDDEIDSRLEILKTWADQYA